MKEPGPGKLLKIVLFTGYSCNNNCRFCIDADKRSMYERSTAELISEISAAARRKADILEIIGGESTIRPDFHLLVKTARKLGIKETICATNGRVFSDIKKAKIIIESGLNSLIFSIHGPDAETHDYLTRAPGSFAQLKKGLDNVVSLGFRGINGNTTVVKQNYMKLPEIAKLYARYAVWNVEFIFVDPTCGGARNDFDGLVPKISEAAPYMREALDIGEAAGLTQWKVRYVPLCLFPDHLTHISEINEKSLYMSEHWAPDFTDRDSIASRAEVSRGKTEKCSGCRLSAFCEGIWKEYLGHFGDGELKPIK